MAKTKHKVTLAVEQATSDLLVALGSNEPVHTYTLVRKSSRPFRECRVENETLFNAYSDPIVGTNIGNYIKSTCPNCIGVYPKAFIPDNRVRRSNNTKKPGLMIHFKV